MSQDNNPDGLWRQDESLRHLEARLKEQPRPCRVVSFDLFDTLVYRLCGEPADLFVEVGRRLADRQLLTGPLTPAQFRSVRVAADARARRAAQKAGKSLEIGLPEIYAQLKHVVADPRAGLEVELQTERDFTFLNPVMAELAQHVHTLGFKTAIISDTYFSRSHLLNLLRNLGLPPELFDAVFLSNESGGAKWDGRLFREACRHFDIHPNELLHIGDNPVSDVRMAAAVGAEAVPYYRTTPRLEHLFECERSLQDPSRVPGAGMHFVRTLTARLATSDRDAYRDGAFVFGPVLTRYADWCVQRFAASGVRRVLALMREGELLGELVVRSAEAAGVKLEVVPCFVSRFSTACASLPEVTVPHLEELFEGNSGLTLHSILEILGILEDAKPYLQRSLLAKPLTTPDAIRGVLQRLCKSTRLRELIEASRARQHELAFGYLKATTEGQERLGILDLGWSGSIQRNLTRILRLGQQKVKTIGCYLATTPRAAQLFLDGDEAHAFLGVAWAQSTILPEIAITACIGSTLRYRRTPQGAILPVLGPFEISAEERAIKQRLRDGVLAFQCLWNHLRATRLPGAFTTGMEADWDAEVASILQRLLEFPSPDEARRLGRLNHDENYWGERLSRPLCAPTAGEQLRREGLQGLYVNPDSYWPQGVVAQHHPRLVSALARRWHDGVALGRLGARPINGAAEGETDDELASLRELFRQFAPQQIIYVGRDFRSVQALVNDLVGQHEWIAPHPVEEPTLAADRQRARLSTPDLKLWTEVDKTKPRIIALDGDSTNEPTSNSMTRLLSGSPSEPESLRAVRSLLVSCPCIALVLSDGLDEATRTAVINGLAPFLGPEGVVMAARGRTYHVLSKTGHLGTRHLAAWMEQMGTDLGFEAWDAPEYAQLHLANWYVLVRGQAARESADYWSLTLPELPLLDQDARESDLLPAPSVPPS